MKSVIKIIYCVSLSLSIFGFSTEAKASADEHWKFVAGGDPEMGFYYDSNSVIKIGDDIRRFWIKSTSDNGSQKKALEELDCRNRVVRDVQTITERPNKSTQLSNEPSSWRDVLGDPAMRELYKTLCR